MKAPSNNSELEALKAAKMGTSYKVKDIPGTDLKDMDFDGRIVKVVPNTYYFMDHDWDVLVPGCAKKTIADNGPESQAKAKIANVKDHDIRMRIGVPQLIDERKIDGTHVMYAESKIMGTTAGNDILIEYKEGAINQHSIGFRYRDIEMITNESGDWNKWVDRLINPEKAESMGFMFLVHEIELIEFSPVTRGSNELTAFLGIKAKSSDTENYHKQCLMKINERIEWMEKQYRNGRQSDETLQDYQIQSLQLKQIISELFTNEPSLKDTLINDQLNKSRLNTADTIDVKSALAETNFLNLNF